jgi:hypothetical protein
LIDFREITDESILFSIFFSNQFHRQGEVVGRGFATVGRNGKYGYPGLEGAHSTAKDFLKR